MAINSRILLKLEELASDDDKTYKLLLELLHMETEGVGFFKEKYLKAIDKGIMEGKEDED